LLVFTDFAFIALAFAKKDKPAIFIAFSQEFQIILLFVIMISATQRLLLYTGNQVTATSARLYPMAFMLAGSNFLFGFALTVCAERDNCLGRVMGSALFVKILHVLNPDLSARMFD